MCNSLRSAGIQVQENNLDSDAVIIWSVLWYGRMRNNQEIYQHYQAQGRPIVVVDIGTLIRGVTWKIGLGNINRSGWFGDQKDRDADRAKKLGLRSRQPTHGDSILVALQHSRSLQAESITDMAQWALYQIQQVRQYSSREIVIRPHPRDPVKFGRLPDGVTIQRPLPVAGTYDSFDWTDSWHAVINHNSGPGVLAAIAGIRPVVADTSLAYPVAVNIQSIEQPYVADREQWLIDIAHTEYTHDEIAQGLWLKRLGSRL